MVNQKLLSFKIDDDIFPQLDALCSEYGIKRNKMLNILCRIGVDNLLGKRSMFMNISVLSSIDI